MKIYFVDGQPVLWAGTEASFDAAVKAQAQTLELMSKPGFELREATYDGSDGLPAMIEKRGDVGILNIEGSLVDGSSGFMRYFGVVGYDDITTAARKLYADPDIKKVLVRVESPGGMVNGIFDAGEQMATLSATKPTLAYSGSQAASGGYWMATSVKGDFVIGPTADIGSIGVVSVHTDVSKMLENEGIKKTVLRSGENKARINAIEPLTPELKAREEAKMADVHNIFRAQVQRARPNLSTEDLLSVTDGSTFLGKRAVKVGLADKVASFEQALKLLDTNNPSGNNALNSKGASMKLSEKQIAMLQSGVPVDQLGLSAEDLAACQAEIDALVNANKDQVDEGIGGAASAPAAGAATTTAPPAAEANVAAELTAANAQVSLLTKQLAEVNDKLVAKTAELKIATDAQAPLQTQVESLLSIARAATGKLQVALGGSNTADSMDVGTVVATHAKLASDFTTKFKIGPVSRTPEAPETKVTIDPELARFRQAAERAAQSRKN